MRQKISIMIVFSVFILLIVGIVSSYFACKPNQPSINDHLPGCQSLFSISPTIPPPKVKELSKARNNSAKGANSGQYLVTRIIDGDTFEIETKQKVRLIGIDTPELNKANAAAPECFGTQAAQKLSVLILNKKVRMEKDLSETDRFGRLLRYVYIDNIFVNQYLVETGYALSTTYPPDIKFEDTFATAQKIARENKRGLWSQCN